MTSDNLTSYTLSAIFNRKQLAGRAVDDIKAYGIPSDKILIVVKNQKAIKNSSYKKSTFGRSIMSGASSGSLIGGLFGIFTSLIPLKLPLIGILGFNNVLPSGLVSATIIAALIGSLIGLTAGVVFQLIIHFIFPDTSKELQADTENTILISVEVESSDEKEIKNILTKYNPEKVTSYSYLQ